MYAKLFSRIAQSSLMEEDVETRYCFMMLLAIADSSGDVIGTDVALARTVNLPLNTFQKCVGELMEPDPNSNSQVQDGRRLIPSSSGRGYFIVNYGSYRSIKTAEEKKAYMREYMQRYRKGKDGKDVTAVKVCKSPLGLLTHAEGEGEGDAEGKKEIQRPAGYVVPACFETVTGFSAALAGWIESRKKMRKPATSRAIQLVIDRCAERPESAVAALNEAVERGWQSFKWEWMDRPQQNGSRQPTPAPKPTPADPAGWAAWLVAQKRPYVPHFYAPNVVKDVFRQATP
jgi:hypothetical protein